MQQFGLARARQRQVRDLDVAVAANAQGQRRDLRGQRLVGGREAGPQFVQARLELCNERALQAPLRAVAEHIEHGAAQRLAARQPLHGGQHPAAQTNLGRGLAIPRS